MLRGARGARAGDGAACDESLAEAASEPLAERIPPSCAAAGGAVDARSRHGRRSGLTTDMEIVDVLRKLQHAV